MPLETAQYVGQLDANNPVGSDPIAQVDEHLRMIKRVLKATFPGLNGPVDLTQQLINNLQAGSVPRGLIAMWSGAVTAVPAGWALCDGTSGTPDLRGRFILGANGANAVGTSGGATTTSAAGGHTHTVSELTAGGHDHTGKTGGHALTVEQMPSHKHTSYFGEVGITYPNGVAQTNQSGSRGNFDMDNPWPYTSTEGGNQAHDHTISSVAGHTHGVTLGAQADHTHTVTPPFFALAYIMKL